jgi:hypothetical protein
MNTQIETTRPTIFDRPELLSIKLADIITALNNALRGVRIKGDSGDLHKEVSEISNRVIEVNKWGDVGGVPGLGITTWKLFVNRLWYTREDLLKYDRSCEQDKRSRDPKGVFHSIEFSPVKPEYNPQSTIGEILSDIRQAEIRQSLEALSNERKAINDRLPYITKTEIELSEELAKLIA